MSGDGLDTGEEHCRPTRAHTPYQPTRREREEHNLIGHASYRSWCDACVRGRGRAQAHSSSSPGKNRLPKLSWDYCYLGHAKVGAEAEELDRIAESNGDSPVLVMTDGESKAIFSVMLPAKGVRFDGVEEAIDHWVGEQVSTLPRACVIFSEAMPARRAPAALRPRLLAGAGGPYHLGREGESTSTTYNLVSYTCTRHTY